MLNLIFARADAPKGGLFHLILTHACPDTWIDDPSAAMYVPVDDRITATSRSLHKASDMQSAAAPESSNAWTSSTTRCSVRSPAHANTLSVFRGFTLPRCLILVSAGNYRLRRRRQDLPRIDQFWLCSRCHLSGASGPSMTLGASRNVPRRV